MTLSRRDMMRIGGLALAGLPLWAKAAAQSHPIEIEMRGNADGSKVWFEPAGLLIQPGQTLRWINRDPGNSHTSTAYHPANDGRPLRIPAGATPWDSDYLLPDEAFDVTLTTPGVYDYFCVPHEHAAMVGRIVVMAAGAPPSPAVVGSPIPELTEDPLPTVEEIMRLGRVSRG